MMTRPKKLLKSSGYSVGGPNIGGSGYVWPTGAGSPPTFSASPVISGEPWPGGTVTSVDGTPSGEDSSTLDWEVDGVSQSETATSYSPVPADLGLDLERVQTATNGAGTTEVRSNVLEVEHLRGVTRNAGTDDVLHASSAPNVPSAFTILIEGKITGGDATYRTICTWLKQSVSGPADAGVGPQIITSTGAMRLLVYVGGSAYPVDTSVTVPQDGSHFRCVYRINGTALTVWGGVPGGSASSDTATLAGSVATASAVAQAFMVEVYPGVGYNRQLEGTLSIAAISRALTDLECQGFVEAAAATGGLRKEGWLDDADLAWSLDPALTESDGDAITASSDLLDTSFALVGGTTDLASGGLNVAV